MARKRGGGDPAFDREVRQLVADIKYGHEVICTFDEAGSPGGVLETTMGLIRRLEYAGEAVILAAMIVLIEED